MSALSVAGLLLKIPIDSFRFGSLSSTCGYAFYIVSAQTDIHDFTKIVMVW